MFSRKILYYTVYILTCLTIIVNTTNQKSPVLFFITTHLTKNHLIAMKYCWPYIIETIPIIKNADIILYTSKPPPKEFVNLFKNIQVKFYKNPGYQEGAIKAMIDAEKYKWMDGYDWVIRINPDVIIRNDTWLQNTIKNPNVDGIFTDCYRKGCIQKCTTSLIHSDFFAFRPNTILKGHFKKTLDKMGKYPNAEKHITNTMQHIVEQGRDAWLPHSKQFSQCRVLHDDIIHSHTYVENCQHRNAITYS